MTKHYIARLSTHGISHGGRELVALGSTPDEAKAAVVRAYKHGRSSVRTYYGDSLRTVADFEEYYGINVYGPMADGQAVEA